MNNRLIPHSVLTCWLLLLSLSIPTLCPFSLAYASTPVVFETDTFRLVVNPRGQIVSLEDRLQGVEYTAKDQTSPLLKLRVDGVFHEPDSLEWHADNQRLILNYGTVRAEVASVVQPTHVTFELIHVEPLDMVDRIQWGPVATTIREVVGETIGVVRNADFAVGLQVLNVKTLGGPQLNDEGRDVSRGMTALTTPWGSTLQAYSMDRSKPRRISVWGEHYPNMPIPPIPGETVIGSRIALFGCPSAQALERIGQIGLTEGLPHMEFNGVWSRMNPAMGRSYLIIEFTEETFAEILGYAERAAFHSVYHGHPFHTWGHYELRQDHFPNGQAGIKACVEAAHLKGLRVGVHTLSNFINTNDPYITPVPDSRLAQTGSSPLTHGIDADQTEIGVESPEYFANTQANWLRTVKVGTELVRYGRVSDTAPWRLLDCQRGAWGTQAQSHVSGVDVAKLMDHPYRVFFPNYEMQHEIAIRLAEFMNETGVGHMDFDGHEGCWASGQGMFAEEMFAWVFYQHLKQPVHNGSSNVRPFHWRINSNANWGEPWYGGFRESQAEYRFNNQSLFHRNFMPNMLGWFQMTAETTRADIEWLMARNAGYRAGFALATSLSHLRENPHTSELLDTIRAWETVRLANVLTEEQREMLRDLNRDFRLEDQGGGVYHLHPFTQSNVFTHEKRELQPGEPTSTQWTYNHVDVDQPVQFTLKLNAGSGQMQDAWFELDGYLEFSLPMTVEAGQTLVCDGSRTLRLYNGDGRQVASHMLAKDPPTMRKGSRQVRFDGRFDGQPAPKVEVRFRSLSDPIVLRVP